MKRTVSVFLFSAALVALAPVQSPAGTACPVTVVVDGQCNVFGAGHAVAPDPGFGGGGILPAMHTLPAASDGNQILTFCSVTGELSPDNGGCFNGPDGGSCASGNTDITSFGGISGLIHNGATMFLVGVFLDDNEPADPAPARLDFSPGELGSEFDELSPALNQTFFIGDGQAIGSTQAASHYPGLNIGQQVFHVPVGTTRFFMGFVDGFDFGAPSGPPGFYGDNKGSLTAIFSITNSPPVPVQTSTWGGIKVLYR